ncbi:nuclear transport factor 2 family protein [Erythrobacter sp. R86502]|uniref:nuclear transport factor 2 family protein n=1 Tax=Erythrobacter sp. R86502 TaxID=3093846 RepID=UPI0036D2D9FA
MKPDLPEPIARYFTADKHRDPAALAACFTPDGTVIDEGNTYAGHAAIRQWLAKASSQYTYTVEPFALAQAAGQHVVTARLEGNFPGSPVDLRYAFAIEDGLIAALTIAP